jgi:hypothetical protein
MSDSDADAATGGPSELTPSEFSLLFTPESCGSYFNWISFGPARRP